MPQDLLDRIRSGEKHAVQEIYMRNRPVFLKWSARKFPGLSGADREDAWHDTIIAFILNVRSGRLKELHTQLTTYLFSIGEHILLKKLGRDKREQVIVHRISQTPAHEDGPVVDAEAERNRLKALMHEAVAGLPAQQQRMVVLRYIEARSIPEIRMIMGYESDNAVRVTLSRAVKQIREQIKRRDNTSGKT